MSKLKSLADVTDEMLSIKFVEDGGKEVIMKGQEAIQYIITCCESYNHGYKTQLIKNLLIGLGMGAGAIVTGVLIGKILVTLNDKKLKAEAEKIKKETVVEES